jgi:uncharacterized repeat protein (TIGR01451 family)
MTETATDSRGRWQAGVALALGAVVAGVAFASTALFLSALVGLVYSGYTLLGSPPDPRLHVTRAVEPRATTPGERTTVTTTVENAGDEVLADVRVHDQPPAELQVVSGATRAAASLAPGETLTVEYELETRRGTHEFGDVTTVVYGLSGDAGRRTVHEQAASVSCFAPFDALELAPQTGPGTGQVETDTGGVGLEFFATREYRSSDPSSRIDWNRYAATGELSTVTYRESHAATVVLLVDGRHRVRRAGDEPTAAALCGYAAVRAGEALLDDHNSVGAVALGGESDHPAVEVDGSISLPSRDRDDAVTVLGYCRPDRGREQSLRIRSLLAAELDVEVSDVGGGVSGSDAAVGSSTDSYVEPTPGTSGVVDWLRERLDDHAQVVFVSPLLDREAVRFVTRLESVGHTVTVVSPRVTTTARPGTTVSHLRRALRVRSLQRDQQVRLVDWSPDDPLGTAARRAHAGWEQ